MKGDSFNMSTSFDHLDESLDLLWLVFLRRKIQLSSAQVIQWARKQLQRLKRCVIRELQLTTDEPRSPWRKEKGVLSLSRTLSYTKRQGKRIGSCTAPRYNTARAHHWRMRIFHSDSFRRLLDSGQMEIRKRRKLCYTHARTFVPIIRTYVRDEIETAANKVLL